MSGPPAPRRVPLGEIADAVGGRLVGGEEVMIEGVSSLEEARPGDLAHVDGDRYIEAARVSQASAFVLARPMPDLARPQLVVENPRFAFVRIVERFFLPPRPPRGVAAQVARGSDVEIGPDVSIGAFVTLGDRVKIGPRVTLHPGVVLGDDVEIGEDSVLYPQVVVRENCRIGRRVIIHSGTVIGSDGFGYVQHEGRHHKIPQLGHVVVEDDVELGANVTVDRATFGRTVIGRGTKVDNLVQVAHNVTIGADSILVAQVGIAGSTRLGARVVVGGQAGLGDHLDVGDGAMIAAGSGVLRNVPAGETVSGRPALPHGQSLRIHGNLLRLPELQRQLRELAEQVRDLASRATSSRPRRRK